MTNDTINNKQIEHPIERKCRDSIVQDLLEEKIYLYGNAEIKYGNIKIRSEFIVINWKESTIYAFGKKDSLGNKIGYPVFSEGNDSFKATKIIYNFKSKKCIVEDIILNEEDGFVHGEKVKKMEDNTMYLRKGEYTTCDHEKPHYSIRSNKIKLSSTKEIITGPAYLTFFNIPTPIILPFGYFPNTKNESSGILIPSYGESANLGFFLKDGGYYFALNKFLDLSIKADIYSKGSWSSKSNLRYKKRYKYNGNINLSYANIINSEQGFPDYSIKRDFFIRWNHIQDPKSNKSINFSANLNLGSSTFHRNNISVNSSDYLTNTFTSSINLSKRWKNTPFSLSSSLSHNQNTQTNLVNLTLPEISLSMNRIFPFKNKNSIRKIWTDNISIRYNMNTRNQISGIDSLFFHKSTLNSFNTGMRHTLPISSSFKLLKYFTFSQNINFNEKWYINQIEKTWDGTTIKTDTIQKFTRGSDYNMTASLNTKLYGISEFRKGKIAAFRHVISPNISFTYNPSFSDEKYGIYKKVQSDSLGNTELYSIMQNGIYGSPRQNKSGNITISIANLIGIKTRQIKDTVERIKKIKIIENLNINTSYNVFADSLNFNYINLNFRTKLFNKINITHSSSYDPYIVNENGRINKFEIIENKRLARFKNSNTSIGVNINDKTFKKRQQKETDESLENRDFFKIPYNLNINYTHSKNAGSNLNSETITTQMIGCSGNLKLTPKWKIGLHTGYDFSDKTKEKWFEKFSYTSLDIYRDLHCWEMLFHWIPIGYQRSYTLTIRVKSEMLQDLKFERKRDWIAPNYN